MNPEIKNLSVGSLTADQLVSGPLVTRARVRLDLPYERPPASLVANSRAHWRTRSRDTRALREAVLVEAHSAGLHRLCDGRVKHLTVELVWAPGDRRRRDAPNLNPMAKVAIDALARGPRRDWVGLDLVPDDTSDYLTQSQPRILPPPEPKGMWLNLQLDFHPTGDPGRTP